MPLATALTRRLVIAEPIIQAPIAGATNAALAAAVSSAGALGMISATWRGLDDIDAILTALRRATERPYGVNLVLEWDQRERLARCLAHGPALVSLFWGDAAPYVPAIHAAGALCAVTAGSAAEAARAVEIGADVIVAQGVDAGGHVRGVTGLVALVPAVVDAVAGHAPVVAAGGIAEGRAAAAALALGADGVWVGTRFLAATEAGIHPRYLERLLAAAETDTVHTTLHDVGWSGAPHRVLAGPLHREWEAAGRPPPGQRGGEGEIVARYAGGAPIPRYSDAMPVAGVTGDIDALAMYAGQGVAQVRRAQPAAEIVAELSEGMRATILRLADLARPGAA